MTTLTAWPSQAEAWLDDRGKPAWIAATVVGFIAFWPVGLGILGYMIWSKRMFNRNSSCSSRRGNRFSGPFGRHSEMRGGFQSSGNTAFDAYKADTLKRLEDEQHAFEAFLERLRAAKDKSEFDQFMDDRARTPRASDIATDLPEPN